MRNLNPNGASYHKVITDLKTKIISTPLKESVIKGYANAMPHYITEFHTLNQKDIEYYVNRENLPLTRFISKKPLGEPGRQSTTLKANQTIIDSSGNFKFR